MSSLSYNQVLKTQHTFHNVCTNVHLKASFGFTHTTRLCTQPIDPYTARRKLPIVKRTRNKNISSSGTRGERKLVICANRGLNHVLCLTGFKSRCVEITISKKLHQWQAEKEGKKKEELGCVPFALSPVYTDERLTPCDWTLLPVDVDVSLQRVAPAPPGHASDGGKAGPLGTPLGLAHLVEHVHVVGQSVLLASQRLALNFGKRRVLSARHHASGVARLAHAAQTLCIAFTEVNQAVLDASNSVYKARAIAAVWFAAFLPVVVDVAGDLVRRTSGQHGVAWWGAGLWVTGGFLRV